MFYQKIKDIKKVPLAKQVITSTQTLQKVLTVDLRTISLVAEKKKLVLF